ncbi:MAG: formate/nitrite transporter family protein, partial [Aestuariivirga sp.]
MGNEAPQINPTGLGAYSPSEVARRIEEAGIAKSRLPAVPLMTLAVLAGSFIALGAAAFTAVMAGTDLSYGPARLLGGLAFSLGLVLVVVAGAELFTGNTLIVMAWVDRKIRLRD